MTGLRQRDNRRTDSASGILSVYPPFSTVHRTPLVAFHRFPYSAFIGSQPAQPAAAMAHGGKPMSRTQQSAPPGTRSSCLQLVLPMLGLACCAALGSMSAPAQAASEGARVTRVAAAGEPYALVRADGKGFNVSGSSDDWDDVRAAQKSVKGEFIWFREGGRSWVIQDAAVMAKARAAWAPLDRLGAQMDGYGKEMDGHGKKMDALGRDMDRAAAGMAHLPKGRDMQGVDEGMEALGGKMEALGRKMALTRDDAERERLGREMEEVGARMEAAGRRIEQAHNSPQVRQAQASMKDVGRQMEQAGQPMDALGKKMGTLGKEMERESKAADRTVRALIRDAQAKGLARPAPSAT
jgi:hypothetical protein